MDSEIIEQKVKERTKRAEEIKYVTVFSFAKLAECRDPEVENHLERTVRYSKIIAKEMATQENSEKIINQEFIDTISEASLLHDIGKVGIEDSILLKPGKLTYEEFEIMKKHTIIGGDMLKSAEEKLKGEFFFKLAKEIAYFHHEKFDGNGYPSGLKGKEIPLAARIIALIDVYDALTSKRIYKDKFSDEETREIIVGESGKHFDPDVASAFLGQEEEFVKVKNMYD